jgi:hypothetical protein
MLIASQAIWIDTPQSCTARRVWNNKERKNAHQLARYQISICW